MHDEKNSEKYNAINLPNYHRKYWIQSMHTNEDYMIEKEKNWSIL